MSDQGVFAVHRGVFDHPMFAPEDYTEREAWLWLISSAVWKPAKVRAGHKVVSLERGQLVFSERFLAQKWGWSKTCVRRFLMKLEREKMIVLKADHDATRITICNYEKYAFGGTDKRTENGPQTDRERTKEEEGNNLTTDRIREARTAPSVFTERSKALADALWKALGITHPIQIPPELAGADWRALEWEKAGWPPDMIDAEARRIGPGKPLVYYEKVFATSFAKRQAPLPVVEVKEAEKLTVVKNVPKSSPFDAAYDRVLEKLNAGFASSSSEERDGPSTGEDHARLLAYRQRQ